MSIKNISLLLFVISAALTACNDNTPNPSQKPVNETEQITGMLMEFTDTFSKRNFILGVGHKDGLWFSDSFLHDTFDLDSGRVYNVKMLLLDETKTPFDTISNEVKEEADNHLFVYKVSGVDLKITITDSDSKQLPLGLETIWKTGYTSSGTIRFILKHQPGVKDGTEAPGDTDVDVVIPFRVVNR